MAIRDILHYPDPRLRNRAQAVERVDDVVRQLLDDMLETMYAAPGIGLAAIQVNVPKRVITIDISEHGDRPLCLVNPEILEFAGSVGQIQTNLAADPAAPKPHWGPSMAWRQRHPVQLSAARRKH